jgi:cytochrome c biogenesis protein CcmG, thiol:disulfide interchange protein DsbE
MLGHTLLKWCRALAVALPIGSQAAPPLAVDAVVVETLQIDPKRVTVIDFFAQWCGSCRKELPLVSAVNKRVDPSKVEFIGVDTDGSLAVAQEFQSEMRAKEALNFRVVNDPGQELVKRLKPRGYPALYIVKDGVVVREHLGALPNVDALIEQDLKALGAW